MFGTSTYSTAGRKKFQESQPKEQTLTGMLRPAFQAIQAQAASPNSSLSKSQEALVGPLAEYLAKQTKQTEGVDATKRVLAGDSDFLVNSAKNYYNDALLGPSMREFERVTRPMLESQFAGYGATLSSRRGKTITDAKEDVYAGAQGQLAQTFSQLIGLELEGISTREGARYLPANEASAFSLSATNQSFLKDNSKRDFAIQAASSIALAAIFA
jgi:hypothetical protein